MAGSYYTKANVKLLLDIASGDTADDSLLDMLGALANQHIDNILIKHDEKIPLQGANVLEDIKLAADFYTAALYKGRREQPDSAKFWIEQYDKIIAGIADERSVDGMSFIADRHNSRYSQSDIYELW